MILPQAPKIYNHHHHHNGGGREVWEGMNMFMALMVAMVPQVYTYSQMCQVVYIKHTQLSTCQTYLSNVVLKIK